MATRCDSHAAVQCNKHTTSPTTNVQYWKSNNRSEIVFQKIKCKSGGNKLPTCHSHAVYYTSPTYEQWIAGQSKCVGYRISKGIDLTSINDEVIISGGNDSFVGSLYNEINTELNSRKKHNIYTSLKTITTPEKKNIINDTDINNAISIIQKYYTIADSDMKDEYGPDRSKDKYTNVSKGDLVKKDNFNQLKDEFNKGVISECICYCDCNAYYVCYCHGNCNYY